MRTFNTPLLGDAWTKQRTSQCVKLEMLEYSSNIRSCSSLTCTFTDILLKLRGKLYRISNKITFPQHLIPVGSQGTMSTSTNRILKGKKVKQQLITGYQLVFSESFRFYEFIGQSCKSYLYSEWENMAGVIEILNVNKRQLIRRK